MVCTELLDGTQVEEKKAFPPLHKDEDVLEVNSTTTYSHLNKEVQTVYVL